MNFYGKADQVSQQILAQFQSGSLPKALAPIFIHRGENAPCRKWSWSNQLITALAGYDDARGFRQWQEVGRHVRKGEHGFPILCPVQKKVTRTDAETDETTKAMATVGFTSTIVFGYPQTDGEPLPERQRAEQFLNSLPVLEVAEAWGLQVTTYGGRDRSACGWYSPNNKAITLAVENLATFAHELIHAADHRLGSLKERGQNWASEVVAELGGATLLYALGYTTDADLGGVYDYIASYAHDAKIEPIRACMTVLNRVCQAVDLILTTAETLRGAGVQGKAA